MVLMSCLRVRGFMGLLSSRLILLRPLRSLPSQKRKKSRMRVLTQLSSRNQNLNKKKRHIQNHKNIKMIGRKGRKLENKVACLNQKKPQ